MQGLCNALCYTYARAARAVSVSRSFTLLLDADQTAHSRRLCELDLALACSQADR